MNTSDFLCGCLQVDRLERRVNHLEHEQQSFAAVSQAKENALMSLQRARNDLARAREQLAELMRPQRPSGGAQVATLSGNTCRRFDASHTQSVGPTC